MLKEFNGLFDFTVSSRNRGRKKKKTVTVTSRMLLDTVDIRYAGEVYSDYGKLMSDRCKICIKDVGDFVVKSSYSEVKDMLEKKHMDGFVGNNT